MQAFYIILLQILATLLSAYLIYYARKKGNNQADKEDLAEITKAVEDVKQKYIEDNEFLKAQLNIVTSRKNLLFNEEKEAIIAFSGCLNKWIWDGLGFNLTDFNHTNYDGLSLILEKMRNDYKSTNVALSKLELLVVDDELIKVAHKAVQETLKFHHFNESIINKLKRSLGLDKIGVNQLMNELADKQYRDLSKEKKEFFKVFSESNSKVKEETFDLFFEKRNELFKPVSAMINEFKSLARKYLND